MPLDWTLYDGFDWSGASQSPMDPAERGAIEDLAARTLGVAAGDTELVWGHASPPGRFASTVVRVAPQIAHTFQETAAARKVGDVAVKIYKTNGDARREFAKLLPFHNGLLQRLPGMPHPRIQQTFEARWQTDRAGSERGTLVQQWVCGQTLEEILADADSAGQLSSATVREFLRQVLGEIIIPLWGVGLVWWDIRDANWCYDSAGAGVTVIDVDSLAAYADEIMETPTEWARRDKGRETALGRLRQTAWRLLETQVTGPKRKAELAHKALWQSEMEPVLRALGHAPDSRDNALGALDRYLARAQA